MTTVLQQLRAWDEQRLARLLALRPELRGATTLEELARLLLRWDVAAGGVAALAAPQRQVFEACCLLPPSAGLDDLAGLDPSADREALAALVAELRDRLLLDPGAAGLQPLGQAAAGVRRALGLGRPLYDCLEHTPYVELNEMLQRAGRPRQRSGGAARTALAELYADPAALAAALRDLPAPLQELLARADAEGPVLRWPGVDPLAGLLPDDPVLEQAVLLGLLAAVGVARVELPREVGLAVRHPAVARFTLGPPTVPGRAADPAPAAAHQVELLLDHVDRLLAAVGAQPPAVLASGGVGVKELRGLAGAVGCPAPEVATLLPLLDRLGLVVASRKALRVTTRAAEWQRGTDADRWTDLVRAWLSSGDLPPPAPGAERRLSAALAPTWDGRAAGARRQLVRVLAAHRDAAHAPQEWLAHWAFAAPPERLAHDGPRGQLPAVDLRRDLLEEAALLALLADGACSPLVDVVVGGADAAQVLARLGSLGEVRVRAQADLTLVCTGRPAREMRLALDGLADVESSGAATVWRLSERSLAPVFDDGRSAEEVVALLERYAGELPQPVRYLVSDAHRRHGRVRVGAAASYAVVEDDAQLQDLLRRRGPLGRQVAAVGLRRVAPSVAVATRAAPDLLELLRTAGLAAVVDTAAPAAPAPGGGRVRAPAVRPLPDLPLDPPADPARLAAALRGRHR